MERETELKQREKTNVKCVFFVFQFSSPFNDFMKNKYEQRFPILFGRGTERSATCCGIVIASRSYL